MLVLPGPAIVVIPLGLAILALEFAWARAWLARVRAAIDGTRERVRNLVPRDR
jgi:tellurite resistance protein TerC